MKCLIFDEIEYLDIIEHSYFIGIGDFYYELGVQIVEVCLATNYKNGGLITLEELRSRLIASRGRAKKHQDITNEDLLAAVKKLRIFGNGYKLCIFIFILYLKM